MKKYKMISFRSLIVLGIFVSVLAVAPVSLTRQGVSSKVTFASDGGGDYKSERKAYKGEVKSAKSEFRDEVKSARREMNARAKNASSISQKKQIRKDFSAKIVEARKFLDQMVKDAKDRFKV